MRIFLSVCLIFLSCAIHAIEKANYPFTTDPIDVVIPCDPKDQVTLNLCIDGIRKQCQQVRRIIVVSQKRLTDNAEWFDESLFPFQQRDIALAMFRGDAEAASRYINMGNRLGWILQQLLKLYAVHTIPGISPNVLVLDADTIFLNPVSFLNARGEPNFTAAGEYYEPYFTHMRRLLPWLKKEASYSGIAHHMLFQKCVIDDLFQTIEKEHGVAAWKAICSCITSPDWASVSEYEIYLNFILARTHQAHIQMLQWNNVESIKNLETYRRQGYTFVSCHSWMRKD